VSDELDKLTEEVDKMEASIKDAEKKGKLTDSVAIMLNIALQLKMAKKSIDIQRMEFSMMKKAEQETRRAFIIGNLSLSASLIALGVGVYTILITVPT